MSEGAEHQPLIIYIDRGKFLKTNVALFLLGGGLTFLAFAPWHHAKGNTNILGSHGHCSWYGDGSTHLFFLGYSSQSQS